MKKLCASLPALVSGLLLSAHAHAQTSGWEKPITGYASNLLGGLQGLIMGVGIVVVIAVAAWGFFAKNPGMYKWALGGVFILVLVQLAPGLIDTLTNIQGS